MQPMKMTPAETYYEWSVKQAPENFQRFILDTSLTLEDFKRDGFIATNMGDPEKDIAPAQRSEADAESDWSIILYKRNQKPK